MSIYRVPDTGTESNKFQRRVGGNRNIVPPIGYGINTSSSAYGGGSKTLASGPQHGMEAWIPAKHPIGSYSGTTWSDGVADSNGLFHIRVQSANILVTGSGSTLTIWYLDEPISDGQILVISPDSGKTLVLKKSGANGNLYLGADTTLTENEFLFLKWNATLTKWVIQTSGTGSSSSLWSGITIDVDKDMQNKKLTNLNDIEFHSTGNPQKITVDGAGKVYDIIASGYEVATLSNSISSGPLVNNGILEVNGAGHTVVSSVFWNPSLKLNNTATVGIGDNIGGVYFDAVNSSVVRKTFALILTKIDNDTAGSEAGSLHFYALDVGGGFGLAEVMTIDKGAITILRDIIPQGAAFRNIGNDSNYLDICYASRFIVRDFGSVISNRAGLYGDGSSNIIVNLPTGKQMKFEENAGSVYAHISKADVNFAVLGHGSNSPTFTSGDALVEGIFAVEEHTSDNQLQIETSSTFATIFCDGGIILQGTAHANRFGVGSPNVLYSGLTYPTRIVSGATTITTDDYFILCSGTHTLTLLDASTVPGMQVWFIKTDSSATTTTLACTGGQTINGHATVTFTAQYYVFAVVSDGTNWKCIQNGQQLA